MLTKRKEREIRMQQAIEAQAYRIQASKKGAIAILAMCGAVGLIAGFLASFKGFCP